jgi:glycosyltransferase involved in cell wall biosynthesis
VKVLQINKLYQPWIGGVEQHVQDLSEELAKNNLEISVLAIAEKGKKEKYTLNKVKIFKAPNHLYKFFKKTLLFSMPINIFFPVYLKKNAKDKDIIHFHLPNPLAVMAYFFAKPKGKIVVMWHSDIVKQKFFLTFYKPILYKFLRKVDTILTTSPNMINNSPYLKNFQEKCQVLHLGIDPKEYILSTEETKEIKDYQSEKKQTELLFVGRLTYYKGAAVLIKSIKNINAHLTIIGDGYLKEECLSEIKKYRLENNITILPSQSRRELIKWFHKCDIFILPSIATSEAFGIVQLEAMICKKPVISTNLPTGVPYVNQDKHTGIIVPVGNSDSLHTAIKELIDNKELREFYGENGYKRVISEFTNEKMAENVMRVYETI